MQRYWPAILLLLWPAHAFAERMISVETPEKPAAQEQKPKEQKEKKAAKAAAKKDDDKKEPPKTEEPAAQFNTVVLQGLNKVTGHISRLEAPVGSSMHFGKLEIIAHRCWTSPPEDSPENAALLEISELKPGEGPQRIFLGWMFSSSPGLSSLEHPVYDISIISCVMRSEPETKEDTQ